MAQLTLAQAKALAADWADRKEVSDRDQAREDYFRDAEPDDLIRMWETGHNYQGGKLTKFEFEALCEAWAKVFGSLPPDQ